MIAEISFILHIQYRCYWWPGDARSQGVITMVLTQFALNIPVSSRKELKYPTRHETPDFMKFRSSEISKQNIFTTRSCYGSLTVQYQDIIWAEFAKVIQMADTHYGDVIMNTMASQITRFSIVYSAVCWGPDHRKHQKLRVTGLCEGNSPVTGEFPAQRASDAENVSIGWRHHVFTMCPTLTIF